MIDKQQLVMNLNHVILIKGFQTLSMSKLAQAVNVSRATLYLSFKNKDELVQAVVQRHLDFFDKYPVPTTFVADEFLPAWLNALLLMGSTTTTFTTELQRAYPALAQRFATGYAQYFTALQAYLTLAQTNGMVVTNLTPDYLIFQAKTLINGVLTQVENQSLTLDQAETYLVATLQFQLDAILAPDAQGSIKLDDLEPVKTNILSEFRATYALITI